MSASENEVQLDLYLIIENQFNVIGLNLGCFKGLSQKGSLLQDSFTNKRFKQWCREQLFSRTPVLRFCMIKMDKERKYKCSA